MAKNIFRRAFKSFCLTITIVLAVLFLFAFLSPYIDPTTWWFNGFTGLLVPYLILLLFFACLFWLVFKPRLVWIPLLSLCFGWQQILVVFAWHPGAGFTKKKNAQNLRIVNWNIQSFNGLSKNKETKKLIRTELTESILKIQPDVICLQEFNNSTQANGTDNIALFTKAYPYYYFSKDYQRAQGNYQSGSIIFSRYPIIDSGRVAYPVAESLIYADIVKGYDTIRVLTTHLQSFKFKKEDYSDIEKIKGQDLETVAASMNIFKKMKLAFVRRGSQSNIVRSERDKSKYPTIICGDFNDVPNSYTYFNIKGDWQDAQLTKGFGIGRTFNSLAPTLRIDYILADNNFTIKQFDLVDEDLSDHIMLVTDLRVKK
jgi:endonuclease/exonuclease/phosphatase family metal-dependent hydrolase